MRYLVYDSEESIMQFLQDDEGNVEIPDELIEKHHKAMKELLETEGIIIKTYLPKGHYLKNE